MKKQEIIIELSDVKRILLVINDSANIDMTEYAMSSLKRRIEVFMYNNFVLSAKELIKNIETDTLFLEQFIESILVKNDEMFRDAEFWIVLSKILQKEYSKHAEINFWLPDTNSYHEPYSLLIVLDNLNMLKKSKVKVSTLSKLNVEKIKNADICNREWKTNKMNYECFDNSTSIEHYFELSENVNRLKQHLTDKINITTHNFLSELTIEQYDVVIFRNKMLYYNSLLKELALQKIAASTKNGAFLAVGINELIDNDRYVIYNESEKIYQRV